MPIGIQLQNSFFHFTHKCLLKKLIFPVTVSNELCIVKTPQIHLVTADYFNY